MADVQHREARRSHYDFEVRMRSFQRHYTNSLEGRDGLEYDGFRRMIRQQLRIQSASEAQILDWFRSCDRDSSGQIDADEFFRFALKCCMRLEGSASGTGQGLAGLLMGVYDKSQDGNMDRAEFIAMASSLGFVEEALGGLYCRAHTDADAHTLCRPYPSSDLLA